MIGIFIIFQIDHDYWWNFAECSGDVYEVGEVYDGSVDVVSTFPRKGGTQTIFFNFMFFIGKV